MSAPSRPLAYRIGITIVYFITAAFAATFLIGIALSLGACVDGPIENCGKGIVQFAILLLAFGIGLIIWSKEG